MECLNACGKELQSLPAPISAEPATYMLGLVTSFVGDVQQYVQGGPDASRLIHENRQAFADFKFSIRRTAPNFLPYPSVHGSSPHFLAKVKMKDPRRVY